MDLNEIQDLSRLLNPIIHYLNTSPPEGENLTLPHDLLLEIHTHLSRYREVLELRLAAWTFDDPEIPEVEERGLSVSQIQGRELTRHSSWTMYYRQIEKVAKILANLEDIFAVTNDSYTLPKSFLFKIRLYISKYLFLLKGWPQKNIRL